MWAPMADAVVDFPVAGTSDQSNAIKVLGDRLEQAFQASIAAPENEELLRLMSDSGASGIKRRDMSFALCCGILNMACERLDRHGRSAGV